MQIEVIFKDGSRKNFPDEQRPGGSYSNSVRYEGNFAIVKDVWDREFAYPAEDIKAIETRPRYR